MNKNILLAKRKKIARSAWHQRQELGALAGAPALDQLFGLVSMTVQV